MEVKRLVWPDFLRVFAAAFVILIHITSIGIKDYEPGSSAWCWSGAFNSISRWSVPLFFMISGMFLLDPDHLWEQKTFMRRNVLRVALCILIFGVLYSFLDQYIYGTISIKSIPIAFYGALTNRSGYHLWFLYELLILYLFTPMLRIFVKNSGKKDIDLVLCVWIILEVVVSTANMIGRMNKISDELFPFAANVLGGYAGYFLLGYRLYKYPLKKSIFHLSLLISLFFLVALPLFSIKFSLSESAWMGDLSSEFGNGSFLLSVAIFSFASRLRFKGAWISTIAKRVFGIYLVHVFWISILFRMNSLKLNYIWPPIMLVIYTVFVFGVSLISVLAYERVKEFFCIMKRRFSQIRQE